MYKIRLRTAAFAVVVLSTGLTSAFAQEATQPQPPQTTTTSAKVEAAQNNPEDKPAKPDDGEIVVTATRTKSPKEATASSIDVVTSEEIQQQQYRNVTDALRQVPGLDVVGAGTPGQATSLFTRGTESNHTSLLLNGRRLQSGLLGGYDLANLSNDNIGRI